MAIYTEAIIWYLLVLDCIAYNILVWSKGRWHNKVSHWLSEYFPLSKGVGVFYTIMMLWLGFALFRMQLVLNFLR